MSSEITNGSCMTTLNLFNTNIGDEEAKALSLNTTLTSLGLGSNYSGNIGDEGAKALSLSTTLTYLDLFNHEIGVEGAKALSLNTTLTALNLHYNNVGDDGAKYLALNTTLISLGIKYNNINDETLLWSIRDRLELNRQQLARRRSQFIQSLIILTRDANNGHSNSLWRRLPPDMRRYILQHAYAGWSLGMPPIAKERCGTFISDNIGKISDMNRKKVPWTIAYRENYTQFALRTWI